MILNDDGLYNYLQQFSLDYHPFCNKCWEVVDLELRSPKPELPDIMFVNNGFREQIINIVASCNYLNAVIDLTQVRQ